MPQRTSYYNFCWLNTLLFIRTGTSVLLFLYSVLVMSSDRTRDHSMCPSELVINIQILTFKGVFALLGWWTTLVVGSSSLTFRGQRIGIIKGQADPAALVTTTDERHTRSQQSNDLNYTAAETLISQQSKRSESVP